MVLPPWAWPQGVEALRLRGSWVPEGCSQGGVHSADAETESWVGDEPAAQSPERKAYLTSQTDSSPFCQS